MKKILIVLFIAVNANSCFNLSSELVDISKILIGPNTLDLVIGQNYQLMVSCQSGEIEGNDCAWSSSNPVVVSVDENGKVSALQIGTAIINATRGVESGVCHINVIPEYIPISTISLNLNTIEMEVGEVETLNVSYFPDTATCSDITWESSDGWVATVSNGVVTARSSGTAIITVWVAGQSAHCMVSVIRSGAVDLGLSVKWAECNIGASAPDEFGFYYSWGETEPKETYYYGTYKWYDPYYSEWVKYNINNGLTRLEPDDDIATIELGELWRMPTADEIVELIQTRNSSDYSWTWKYCYGSCGWEVVYKHNNKSLFLPAAGYYYSSRLESQYDQGHYWSSDLQSENNRAWDMHFDAVGASIGGHLRECGCSIRPVREYKKN